MNQDRPATSGETATTLDAVVIGAGFSGLYALHQLVNRLGLNVRLIDRAEGVGGTWYWNRYPGARSDVESFVYSYSFDPELRDEWNWKDRYPHQEEILSYLEHVADRFELRRHMELGTSVTSARFDETASQWVLSTDKGETIRCQYLITAMGLLSAINFPNIPGRELFQGKFVHTADWPREGLALKGKRVAVIGTGSTGIQVITATAPEAGHLTVFQRTPQYSVPAKYGPMPADFIARVKADYENIWQDMRGRFCGCGIEEATISGHSVDEAERQQIFEQAWDQGGGFRFMMATFYDVVTDPEVNEMAASFIREKIRALVKDEETARILTPTGLYARRPVCDMGYYETFNRDNVTLVDVSSAPIVSFTANGLRTADAEYEFDIVIFATGFEAVDGNYIRLDLRGRNGLAIKDRWADGSSAYLGVATAGFPNMFMVLGSHSAFANLPTVIESQVEFIGSVIDEARSRGVKSVEATQAAEDGWVQDSIESANRTLFSKVPSWLFGANIPGKRQTVMFNMNGLGSFRQTIASVEENGFSGFLFDGHPLPEEKVRQSA